MCRKSRFNSKSHLAECCSFIFNPFMTLSYRNQSIDLQWTGFYMITTSVMKKLIESKIEDLRNVKVIVSMLIIEL